MSSLPQRFPDTLAQVKHFSYLTTGHSVDKALNVAGKIVKEVRKH